MVRVKEFEIHFVYGAAVIPEIIIKNTGRGNITIKKAAAEPPAISIIPE